MDASLAAAHAEMDASRAAAHAYLQKLARFSSFFLH
jgi:tRNA(Arg) A34 adenosine deaminase TadA